MQTRNVDVAISNTFGFGGHNAAVVIRKFNPQIGQYEVIDSLPMLGQTDESGVQLTLF